MFFNKEREVFMAVITHDIVAETAMKLTVHPKVLFWGFAQLHEHTDEQSELAYIRWFNHGEIRPQFQDYLLGFWKKKKEEQL